VSKLKTVLSIGCGGCVLLAALGGGWLGYRSSHTNAELDERVVRIQQRVQAIETAGAAPRPVLLGKPQPGNAVDAYRALGWAWGAEGEPDSDLDPSVLRERAEFAGRLPDEVLDELRVHLEGGVAPSEATLARVRKRLPLLHYLRTGLRRERCEWEQEFALGALAPFPRVLVLRQACEVQAYDASITTDPDRALRRGMELIAFAQDADRHPSLIMGMLAGRFEELGLRVLERALNRFELSDDQLARVAQFLAKLPEPTLDLHRETEFIQLEVSTLGLAGRYLDPELTAEDLEIPAEYSGALGQLFVARELRGVDHFAKRAEEVCALDYPQRVEFEKELVDEVSSSTYILGRIASPNFTAAMEHLDERCALRRCVAGLIAAHRARLEQGQFPAQLSGLAPDPFRPSSPLGYVVAGDTVRVYSVGLDQVDDGGERDGPTLNEPDLAVHSRVPAR